MTTSHAEVGSFGESRVHAGIDRLRALFLMFVNPGAALKGALAEVSPMFALGVSGTAFGLLFLQTGLDLLRVGQPTLPLLALTGPLGVVGLCLLGVLYGTLGVSILGAIAFSITRPFGATLALGPTVRAIALGYSPALFYALLGVVANVLLGWNTAVAFGVTGLLWALGPMIATLRAMLGGQTRLSVILATVLGGIMLLGWAFLGT
jgi:hypothetical protein